MTRNPEDDFAQPSDTDRTTAILVESHRDFLRYLERRFGSREIAEDVLQDALVRSLDHGPSVPDEALVPWFYRVLRNAVIDQYRRRAAADKALAAFAEELKDATAAPVDLEREICACVSRLAETLKPEYRDALKEIDLDGTSVKTFAERQGLSANNAGVRVFRARQALKKRVAESCGTCAEHGCFDCTCGSPAGRK